VEARSREIVSLFHSALRRNSRARYCQVSAGAAVWEHGDTAVQLFKKAELALHATKTNRSDSVGLFTPELLADVQRTTAEIELAREAVKECWIVPYYQPIVTLSDATIAGFEALLRINHPRRGTLSPAAIANTLDHPRLGKAIGERMIEVVAADLEKWSSTTAGRPRVSVNLSASNLTDPNFCGWVLTTLKARNVPANLLTFEITERIFLDDLTVSLTHLLGQLRQLGMGIALDDFGTGYASLTHLQKFPVTEIKIDRSFVMDGLSTNSGSAAIVRSMIMLGRNLGLNLVAEGVESAEQLSLLRSWGCQMAQGFYYSPPLPYADAKRMWSEGLSHSSSGR
jgi:EAL domain-containing protein (putative c-di-GMP-specific phosphodiesterase class I)